MKAALCHGRYISDYDSRPDCQNGVGGGTGRVFEYMGDAVRSLSMEARMTMCNMSTEGGARRQ